MSVLSKVEIMLNIIPPPLELLLGQRYSLPPYSTEVPSGTPSQGSMNGSVPQGLLLDDDGVTVSLDVAGTTVALEDDNCSVSLDVAGAAVSLEDTGASAELAGSIVKLIGSAAELLDSSADEIASISELLTGSWLRGMLTELLELLGAFST